VPKPWTRRELLAAFLGAPLAAACASRNGDAALPPGSIVGPAVDVGHRVRDGLRLDVQADAWRDVSVVIVGGGMAGLAAAWRLKGSGFDDFALLELESEPGGTSRSGTSPVVPYPWGAHYVPAPFKEDRALVTLLDEMGVLEGRDEEGEPVVREEHLCRDPQERIYYRGRWYEGLYLSVAASAEDRRQMDAFRAEMRRWSEWRDGKGRFAFAIPVANGSDDPEVTALDRITMAEWLDERGFTSPRLRWYVEYACRDDYGSSLERTSAWAGVFYFTSRVDEEGGDAQPLVTWPEGNGRIVSYLHGRSAGQARLGTAVAEVRPVGDGREATVEVVALDVGANRPVGFRARRVIFAAPRFMVARLVTPLRDDPPPYLAEFEYSSWTVANLWLRDRPSTPAMSFPPCWDNVLYESPSLGYISATHQALIDHGPTVLTWYYPIITDDARSARARLLSADRDEWAEVALSDLEIAHHDIRRLAERVDVMRWGHAMVTPRPGFIWGGALREAIRPYRGIHFAHTDLSGMALFEEALHHGVRAAEEVLEALGRPVESLA
jgi:glycine/D-amino acid oxidase-like deaminating enzyme